MRTIANEWAKFEAVLFGSDAPLLQRQEMKKVFYGGAAAMMSISIGLGELSDQAAFAVLEGIQAELVAYAEEQLEALPTDE